MNTKIQVSTLWISDIHLGNRDCKAELLLDFLEHIECKTLYLVGDIIDMWQMSKQFRWPQSHNDVLHKLVSLSRNGTRVVFLPGNHDAPLQQYSGMQFGDIEIMRETIHETASGKRYLVLHGDQFDDDVMLGRFHHWIGDHGYNLLLTVNRWYNAIQQIRKRKYWSLAGYVKQRIAGANLAIARFKSAACHRAAKIGVDGVICGHIHHPESSYFRGVHYINDGDWVENCTAIYEDHCGTLKLLHWAESAENVTPINAPRPNASKAA